MARTLGASLRIRNGIPPPNLCDAQELPSLSKALSDVEASLSSPSAPVSVGESA